MVLEAIRYSSRDGTLYILDQLQLPYTEEYMQITSAGDAWEAIHRMQVRGAPAIAIVAALGLSVELQRNANATWRDDAAKVSHFIKQRLQFLVTSRPTAVNLARAAADLTSAVEDAASAGKSGADVIQSYLRAAEDMLESDRSDNRGIGDHGASWIKSHSSDSKPVSVLTHCNTGSLATAGYGTALGIVRSLHGMKHLEHAYCTETRPYNQGSRLTAYELVHDNIPATLVTDSMAAALLRQKGTLQNIAAIVVGADRVAANGDTANKIGTYALAIHARHHGVKFIVAAPRTTIDMRTPSGDHIKIEERAPLEMTTVSGPKMTSNKELDLRAPATTVSIAAQGIDVWNPAFDVTPHDLIDAIVTEVGVAEKDGGGSFDLQKFMDMPRQPASNGHS